MSVAAVIPAYNEEKTIKTVIKVVKEVDKIDRIIVVSDGSEDQTASISEQCGAEVIRLSKNIGKGGAMCKGVKKAKEDIILFLDADLVGLTKKHVEDLIDPVLTGETGMTLGVFTNGKMSTDLAQKITPFLSGQRALKREVFNKISNMDISRYGAEMALTRYVRNNDIPYIKVKLPYLTHITKEKKLGLIKGFASRLKMYWEIVKEFKIAGE